MNDHIRQASEFLMESVQESARQVSRDHSDAGHKKGFTSAAGITLRHIQEKLDVFKEQMKSTGLNKVEQAVYVQLDELKSVIEADCDRYWRETGVDWRPREPLAKAVARRRTEESMSED